jgi:predicted transcriptional regulator
MMVYKSKYTKDDFLRVLSTTIPKSTTDIQLEVGCSKSTAKNFLEEREADGKVQRFKVKGGSRTGEIDIWMLKEEYNK